MAPSDAAPARRVPWIVAGDWDGLAGLLVDNLLTLMLLAMLCPSVCGIPEDFVVRVILPGAAVSILVGNLGFAWQARRLMQRTGRDDATALPYGIALASLLTNIYLIMGPVYAASHDWRLAYHVGLFACFFRSLLETLAAFGGTWLRRLIPRTALLSPLVGLAVIYYGVNFVIQIFDAPGVSLLPLFLLLVGYTPGIRLPGRLPAGLLAVAVGTALAWGLRALGYGHFNPPPAGGLILAWPHPAPLLTFAFSATGMRYLSVILPIALIHLVEALQVLEAAELAGDRYDTRTALLVNGLGGIAASAFGSCFPTVVYLGHGAWKKVGARAGYSVLNGLAVALLCLSGGISWILSVIPMQPSMAILMWVGLATAAQALVETPPPQILALLFGLLPMVAQWGVIIMNSTAQAAGQSLAAFQGRFGDDFAFRGLVALSQGALMSSLVLSALLVCIVNRSFAKAAGWALLAAGLSALGLIHAFRLTASGIQSSYGWFAAPEFALTYAALAAMLWLFHLGRRRLAA